MSDWKVRHQGSPKAVENLTLEQIVEGLMDGHWEPTDEVMGPQDTDWVAIENHPLLADAAAEVEPPPRREDDDETRLDMNPLIDVCLVLLVFFMLTVTYGHIQKQLLAADLSGEADKGPLKLTREQIGQTMIVVTVNMENNAPVIRLEGQVVDPPDGLEVELKRLVGKTRKLEMVIEPGPGVRRKTIVAVQDAAAGASILKVNILTPQALLPPPAPP